MPIEMQSAASHKLFMKADTIVVRILERVFFSRLKVNCPATVIDLRYPTTQLVLRLMQEYVKRQYTESRASTALQTELQNLNADSHASLLEPEFWVRFHSLMEIYLKPFETTSNIQITSSTAFSNLEEPNMEAAVIARYDIFSEEEVTSLGSVTLELSPTIENELDNEKQLDTDEEGYSSSYRLGSVFSYLTGKLQALGPLRLVSHSCEPNCDEICLMF